MLEYIFFYFSTLNQINATYKVSLFFCFSFVPVHITKGQLSTTSSTLLLLNLCTVVITESWWIHNCLKNFVLSLSIFFFTFFIQLYNYYIFSLCAVRMWFLYKWYTFGISPSVKRAITFILIMIAIKNIRKLHHQKHIFMANVWQFCSNLRKVILSSRP